MKQAYPMAALLRLHMTGEEFASLDEYSPIPMVEQLDMIRAGLPTSLLAMARGRS